MTTHRRATALSSLRPTPRAAAVCVLTWLLGWNLCPTAEAAFPARILVITARSVPSSVRASANAAIAGAGTLVDPSEYAAAARAAGLDPNGVEALSNVGPSMGARLIVLIGVQQRTLRVAFRDGRSAAAVHDISLPLHRQKLERREAKRLEAATRHALSLAARDEQAPTAVSPADEVVPVVIGEELGPSEPPEAEPAQPEPSPNPPWRSQDTRVERRQPTLRELQPETQHSKPSEEPSAQPPQHGLVGALGFGAGVSERSVRLPTRSGERRLDTSFFPALDLSLGADAVLGEHGLLGAHAHYQTSVGLKAAETLANGSAKETSLRAHRVELGVTPGYRFTTTESSVSVRLFAGWALRGLRPLVDAGFPAYGLHGALLRIELQIPIAGGAVSLRLAPELLMIVGVTGELRRVATAAGSGLAWGGEASVDVRLAASVYLVLAYRESRAALGTTWTTELTDTERFATARLSLRY